VSHLNNFDVPEMDTRANVPSFAASLSAKRDEPLFFQSKHAKSLGEENCR
jgi:hypothetical protein